MPSMTSFDAASDIHTAMAEVVRHLIDDLRLLVGEQLTVVARRADELFRHGSVFLIFKKNDFKVFRVFKDIKDFNYFK